MNMEEPKCRECGANIEEGSVVAFGDGIWHLHCFRCQKCHSMVECDSNLLLLSNGNPVCENCSYRCAFCKKEILDEAIMTGDESYHTNCFLCYRCGNRIENLVFGKTSQGICCMMCHNEKDVDKNDEAVRSIDAPYSVETQVPQIPPRAESLRSFDTSSHKRTPSCNSSFDVTISYDGRSLDAPETDDEQLDDPIQSLDSTHSSSENLYRGKSSPRPATSRSLPGTPIASRASISSANGELLPSSASVNRSLTSLSPENQNDSVQKLSSLVTSPLPQSSSVLLPSEFVPSPATRDRESICASDPSKSPVDIPERMEATELYPIAYVEELIADLKETKSRLVDAETNFNRIKTISIKALEEFNRAKEEFKREVAARQKAEATVKALQGDGGRLQAVLREREKLAAELERVQGDYANMRFEQTNMREAMNALTIEKEYLTRQFLLAGNPSSNGKLGEAKGGRLVQGESDSLAEEIPRLARDEKTKPKSENVNLSEITREFQRMNQLMNAVTPDDPFSGTKSPSIQSRAEGSPIHHRKQTPSEPSFERSHKLTILERKPVNYNYQGRTAKLLDDQNAVQPSGNAIPTTNVNHSRRYSAEGLSQRTAGETTMPRKFKWMGIMGTKEKDGKDGEDKESTGSQHLIKTKTISKSDPASLNTPSLSAGSKKDTLPQDKRREHYFQPHTFLRPLKCDLCNEKMWGLQLQAKEMRCYICGYHSHAKCVAHVPYNCPGVGDEATPAQSPHPAYIDPNHKPTANGLVGRDLSLQVELEKVQIPLIVTSCIAAVEARGLDLEGIYRKSGPASMARSILAQFNKHESSKGLDPPPNLLNSDAWPDITAVTSVLKQYFRELPNPLLTFEAYPALLKAVRGMEGMERVDAFRSIIATFPTPHRDAFRFLLRHLQRVCAQQSVNLMSAKNLAVVFGPTLLREKTASTDSEMMDMVGKNSAIEIMILHSSELLDDNRPPREQEPANTTVDVPPKAPLTNSTVEQQPKLSTFLEMPGTVLSARDRRDSLSLDPAGFDIRAVSPSIDSSSSDNDDEVYLSMSESEKPPRNLVDKGFPRTKVGYI